MKPLLLSYNLIRAKEEGEEGEAEEEAGLAGNIKTAVTDPDLDSCDCESLGRLWVCSA